MATTFRIPLIFSLPLILASFAAVTLVNASGNLQENSQENIFLSLPQIPFETKSQFSSKILEKKQELPFKIIYQKDPKLEWGKLETVQQGKRGINLHTIETLFWKGQETGKRIYDQVVSPSVSQVTLVGTKLTSGEVDTPGGKLAYKGKMRVFATSYDKNCRGCNETTATGAKLGFGIVAVDPNFIPLGSKVYVQGYGIAEALDTGGAIKGSRIDLAFDDVKAGFWRSRWTEVFLLE